MKKTLRGHRQVLRGRSVTLARQEIWAFLTVHNMICALAAQAAALQAIDPDAISFAAVLRLVRHHFTADTCCRHCGKRPTSANCPRPAGRSPTSSPTPKTG